MSDKFPVFFGVSGGGSSAPVIINGLSLGIKTITNADSPYTPAANEDTILVDASGGAVTVTLDTQANTTAGKVYNIKLIDATNALTIDNSDAVNIDNSLNYVTGILYEAVTVQADGTQWWLI